MAACARPTGSTGPTLAQDRCRSLITMNFKGIGPSRAGVVRPNIMQPGAIDRKVRAARPDASSIDRRTSAHRRPTAPRKTESGGCSALQAEHVQPFDPVLHRARCGAGAGGGGVVGDLVIERDRTDLAAVLDRLRA